MYFIQKTPRPKSVLTLNGTGVVADSMPKKTTFARQKT
jgi:hypothetical protein